MVWSWKGLDIVLNIGIAREKGRKTLMQVTVHTQVWVWAFQQSQCLSVLAVTMHTGLEVTEITLLNGFARSSSLLIFPHPLLPRPCLPLLLLNDNIGLFLRSLG